MSPPSKGPLLLPRATSACHLSVGRLPECLCVTVGGGMCISECESVWEVNVLVLCECECKVCDGVSMRGDVNVCVHVSVHVDAWMHVGVCRCECMDLFVSVSVCTVYVHECVCVPMRL